MKQNKSKWKITSDFVLLGKLFFHSSWVGKWWTCISSLSLPQNHLLSVERNQHRFAFPVSLHDPVHKFLLLPLLHLSRFTTFTWLTDQLLTSGCTNYINWFRLAHRFKVCHDQPTPPKLRVSKNHHSPLLWDIYMEGRVTWNFTKKNQKKHPTDTCPSFPEAPNQRDSKPCKPLLHTLSGWQNEARSST